MNKEINIKDFWNNSLFWNERKPRFLELTKIIIGNDRFVNMLLKNIFLNCKKNDINFNNICCNDERFKELETINGNNAGVNV